MGPARLRTGFFDPHRAHLYSDRMVFAALPARRQS